MDCYHRLVEAVGGGRVTLTAITREGTVLRPQAEINAGVNELMVARKMRVFQSESDLFCPHCYTVTGEFIPVKYRNCAERSCHFYHQRDAEQKTRCSNYRPETEKHLNAKAAIAEKIRLDNLFAIQDVVIAVDRYRLQGDDTSDRKPDILVLYKNGAKEAHEVQISALPQLELNRRTLDLKVNHGCGRVVWYLYGKAYNRQNRLWLSNAGVEHYHLTFQRDEDGTYPEWHLAPKPEDSTPKSSSRDTCDLEPQLDHRLMAEKAERMRQAEIAKTQETDLYRWLLFGFQCPSEPFEVKPCQQVIDPVKWLGGMRQEVQKSLDYLEGNGDRPSPRHRTGALQAEVKILRDRYPGVDR